MRHHLVGSPISVASPNYVSPRYRLRETISDRFQDESYSVAREEVKVEWWAIVAVGSAFFIVLLFRFIIPVPSWPPFRKKFVPQSLFDLGAASIAKVHLLNDVPIAEHAEFVYEQWYRDAYLDDGVQEDWIWAAGEALRIVDVLPASLRESALHHFEYFSDKYHPDGRRRAWRLLDGTRYNQAPHNPRRREDFSRNLLAFLAMYVQGRAPAPPAGWGEV